MSGALPQEAVGRRGYPEKAAVFHGCREEHDAGPSQERADGAHPSPQGGAEEPAAHVPVSCHYCIDRMIACSAVDGGCVVAPGVGLLFCSS